MSIEPAVRAIAIYLPQFHPIPENDLWWGKGFTEWTNVAKARPLFRGHNQPHLPADLGFYDLRLPETRQAQADLAREYGIEGFCYYHYWFNGKRLLERPFNEVLESGQPDFPFCLCWANENWTRTWDGKEQEVLQSQRYSEEDDRNHIRSLEQAFADRRYIRVQGKPLFLIYRASQLPDAAKTISTWREEAQRLGIGEIFLCRVESHPNESSDCREAGFDASMQFAYRIPYHRRGWRWWVRRLGITRLSGPNGRSQYINLINIALKNFERGYRRFPCVVPSWDNSARRQTGAYILENASPCLYEKWLMEACSKVSDLPNDERIVFINAWNEWGEGNHLEPCTKWGRAYLEATSRAICVTR